MVPEGQICFEQDGWMDMPLDVIPYWALVIFLLYGAI